ncbi:MAG: hypothetical protein UV64_C0007G0028 [Parcubacteria group bacterium GW2011_GWC1_43_11b]|nr:MAG: hypothetical protein UV64_C0007G0028 [Parcubacteria group bacterium GW2011_GWC1_43_11b]
MPTEKKVRRIMKQRIHVDRRGAIYDIHAALQVLDSLNGSISKKDLEKRIHFLKERRLSSKRNPFALA